MKFIHTADIHLDSPLTGLSAYQDAPTALLRTATRDAFDNLVSEAITEEVDFMIIAGDLYDGSWKDFNTGLFFVRQMGRLKQVGIQVYLLLGNHDAENEMTKRLTLPDNVHKFPSNKAATFRIDSLQVALHGRSFKEAATTDNLAVTYPAPVEGWLNIGVLHTALEGNAAHPNYAPCSVAELEARGYQYWALGHVHEHRVWRGGCVIAYPGNLQGRHIREPGPRGALIVTSHGQDIESVERLHTDVLRWHSLIVDVSVSVTLQQVIQRVGYELSDWLDGASPGKTWAVRVILTGATAAHGVLFGLASQLRAEVLALAATLGSERVWIEKVKIETTPLDDASAVGARGDAIADLQALLVEAEFDTTFMADLHDKLMELVGKVPIELMAAVPLLEDIRKGRLQDLVRAATPSLIAHVAGNSAASLRGVH